MLTHRSIMTNVFNSAATNLHSPSADQGVNIPVAVTDPIVQREQLTFTNLDESFVSISSKISASFVEDSSIDMGSDNRPEVPQAQPTGTIL